jgi:hypothetical protein
VGNTGTTVETPRGDTAAPTRGTARWGRGGTVGLAAIGLALLGHVIGGGIAPPTIPLLVLALLAVLCSVGLSVRRWSLGALFGVLVCVQGAFHVAFGDLTTRAADSTSHLHHGVPVMAAHPLSWRMVVSHLLAVLVTGLLLRRGEAWCWQLAALFGTRVRAVRLLAASVAAPDLPRTCRAEHGPMVLQARLLVLSQARRGPPASLAV